MVLTVHKDGGWGENSSDRTRAVRKAMPEITAKVTKKINIKFPVMHDILVNRLMPGQKLVSGRKRKISARYVINADAYKLIIKARKAGCFDIKGVIAHYLTLRLSS